MPPRREGSEEEDRERMEHYYNNISQLEEVKQIVDELAEKHLVRIQNLEDMAGRAHRQIWYPFTQHKDLSEKGILTIDSASGDFFQTRNGEGEEASGLLSPTFDGSASWWTQGLGHGNPELSLAAAYAAGRYGQ
jgi:dethiobiotin synthetase/adenosylmethionine--8-amino-7-oxononanoate aminotransferase